MSKMHCFDRENLLNLLKNYQDFFTLKIRKRYRELEAEGKSPLNSITKKETYKWMDEFIDTTMRAGEVKTEDILDDLDEVLQKVTGKALKEVAKDKLNNIN